jgi:hypothetical protein
MQQWGYTVVGSQGGQVQTPSGPMAIPQMLNFVGPERRRASHRRTCRARGSGMDFQVRHSSSPRDVSLKTCGHGQPRPVEPWAIGGSRRQRSLAYRGGSEGRSLRFQFLGIFG